MRYIYTSCFILLLFSCENKTKPNTHKKKHITLSEVTDSSIVYGQYDSLYVETLYSMISNYIHTSSDINISFSEDLLASFDSIINFNSLTPDKDSLELSIDILFLKQYLYHLRCCNQSYNIDIAKDKRAQQMLNILKMSLNIDTSRRVEMISSSHVYKCFPEHLIYMNQDLIHSLMDSINQEGERIMLL